MHGLWLASVAHSHRSGRNSVLFLDVAVSIGAPSDVGRRHWLVQVKENL